MNILQYEGRPDDTLTRSGEELGVYDMLDTLGVLYTTACHEAAATMEVCKVVEKALGVPIAKNLFLCPRNRKSFYLLMMPADKAFKTRDITSQIGCARLSFAPDDKMMELLRIHPGAVSPLGLMNDVDHQVQLVVDNDLMADEYIGVHPCVNTSTVRVRLGDLLDKILSATGHDYIKVELPDYPPQPCACHAPER